MALLGRRSFLGALAATWPSIRAPEARADAAVATPSAAQDFDVLDFTVDGDRLVGNRFVLCVPTHLAKDEKVPLLVALHGAAETSDPRTGAYAFVERYGLGAAYARLRRPPVVRTLAQQDYFGDKLLAELNASLVSRPFRGIAIACPYMPWAAHTDHETKVLDEYTSWIADVVIPRARKEAPVLPDAAHTTIDGVSLGGYTSIEVFLRRPELFGAGGCVQGALGSARIAAYADRLAAMHQRSPKDLHLETSKSDPFHDTTLNLSDALAKRGVPHELLVYPGPHDQPWLRESGTIGMLRWHDERER